MKSKGTEGWVNPNQIVLISDLHDNGFAKLQLNGNFICFVDSEGHQKIMNYFKPKKWYNFFL
jgi:hypothetical protein